MDLSGFSFAVDVAILGTLAFQGWVLWRLLPEIIHISRKTDGVSKKLDGMSPFDGLPEVPEGEH